MTLEGKTALVTGGARGLGAAICRELARGGAKLVVADIDQQGAQAVAQSLPNGARAVKLDLADQLELAAVLERTGAFDVLVNNAGLDFTVPVEELTPAQWDAVMNVNLRGAFLMCRHAVRVMKPRRSGHIVNIASTASKRAWPNAAAYHASKWGLLGFSHALHAELRPHRIKVSAVVAGGMRTPFLLDRFPDLDPGLLQDPANVAATVRYLLTLPDETVIPEVMVIPMRESSWP